MSRRFEFLDHDEEEDLLDHYEGQLPPRNPDRRSNALIVAGIIMTLIGLMGLAACYVVNQ